MHSTDPPTQTQPKALKNAGLSEIDELLLRSLYNLHYATIPQLVRLSHGQVTRSRFNDVAKRLKRLEHAQYIERGTLGQRVRFTRNPSVFRLAPRGINHQKKLGLYPLPRFGKAFPGFERLRHTLYVNDIILVLKQLLSETPGYVLNQYLHDWLLRHMPVFVSPPLKSFTREKIAVIPDAWFDISLPRPDSALRPPRMPIHFELDRGTEDSAPLFQPMIAARLAYLDGPYEQTFHTSSVTIAYATTEGITRRDFMKRCTEEVLKATNRETDAAVFFFTALPRKIDPRTGKATDELDIDPYQLFFQPVWVNPFSDTPKILLDANTGTQQG